MNKRIAAFILILLIMCSLLSGCFDSVEIDDLTYVIAIGLDKGKVEPLKLTLQYAIPKALGEGGGKGGGAGGKALGQITLESPTLFAGLNMANGFIGKQVNLSHAVVTIISDELAREDISGYIYGFARGREIRPNMYIAVCRGSAEDYLKTISPEQEVDPAKYYELLFTTYRYTAFVPNSQLFKFYNQAISTDMQPAIALAGIGIYKSTDEFDPNRNTAKEKGKPLPLEGDFLAGEIPKVGDQEAEIMGIALFDGVKMVGELDGASATNYLMVTGEYKSAYVTIPDPKSPGEYVVLNVSQSRKPVRKVEFVGGKPKNSVDITLEADFISIQSSIGYENPKDTPIIEKAASGMFQKGITSFLNRTAKEFKVDVCGFGREAKKKFLTWDEWESFNWLNKYKDSSFEVNVDLKIRRPGLLIHSSPFVSSEREGSSK